MIGGGVFDDREGLTMIDEGTVEVAWRLRAVVEVARRRLRGVVEVARRRLHVRGWDQLDSCPDLRCSGTPGCELHDVDGASGCESHCALSWLERDAVHVGS